MLEYAENPQTEDAVATSAAGLKIIKRDGRSVAFDDQKILAALVKAEKKIHGTLSPLAYEKIQMIVGLVVKEIQERFSQDIKIYEIQNIVEHMLLEKMNTNWLKNISVTAPDEIFSAAKQQISISPSKN